MLLWDNNYPEGYLQVIRYLKGYHTLSSIQGRYSKSGQFKYTFEVNSGQQIPIFLKYFSLVSHVIYINAIYNLFNLFTVVFNNL